MSFTIVAVHLIIHFMIILENFLKETETSKQCILGDFNLNDQKETEGNNLNY